MGVFETNNEEIIKNIKIVNNSYTVSYIIERLELLKKQLNVPDEIRKYIILQEPSDKSIETLNHPVINDKKSSTNKNTAFVQKQTYTDINNLRSANYTSELID